MTSKHAKSTVQRRSAPQTTPGSASVLGVRVAVPGRAWAPERSAPLVLLTTSAPNVIGRIAPVTSASQPRKRQGRQGDIANRGRRIALILEPIQPPLHEYKHDHEDEDKDALCML